MKNLIFLATIFMTLVARAAALDTPDRAKAVKNKLSPVIFQIKGVNGIGVGGCNPQTGAESNGAGDFVHCVAIYAETQAAFRKLNALYPQGTQIGGVYVIIRFMGPVEIQPRMTTGN